MAARVMSPLIEVRRVHKRFGHRLVLRGLDLAVEAGQVTALLGANGAGKTTLMRIIAGLARPDRGEVVLGGATMTRTLYELRRYIGLVAHAPLLYESLTGWENLEFFARLYDVPNAAQRIAEVLHLVDLWSRRNDLVRAYSRGMVQRLAIGRAMVHNPPVLLLDEPDTGLDPTSAHMLHDLVRSLAASNRAILFSTHNLGRAAQWADEVCVLADGLIARQMPTEGLTGGDLERAVLSKGKGL